MRDYLAAEWKEIFSFNGLGDFQDLWALEADWFEVPNERRGGWSGVARCELKLPHGGVRRIFLKRQQNHVTKSWRHPLRGVATLAREFRNFQKFERGRVPTARIVYFAQRTSEGHRQAMLATEELSGFRSLEELTKLWSKQGWPNLPDRRRIIQATADAVRRMHDARIRHNCLAAKHVFLRLPETSADPVDVRIIDLEKARWIPWRPLAARGDLSLLLRHCPTWRPADIVRFYKAYLQVDHLRGAMDLWEAVAQRNKRKRENRERRKTAGVVRKKQGAPAPLAGRLK